MGDIASPGVARLACAAAARRRDEPPPCSRSSPSRSPDHDAAATQQQAGLLPHGACTRSAINNNMSDQRSMLAGDQQHQQQQQQQQERIAHYKEARRKALATQFASLASPLDAEPLSRIRTTRTSRLRAATSSDATSPRPSPPLSAVSPVSTPRKPSTPDAASPLPRKTSPEAPKQSAVSPAPLTHKLYTRRTSSPLLHAPNQPSTPSTRTAPVSEAKQASVSPVSAPRKLSASTTSAPGSVLSNSSPAAARRLSNATRKSSRDKISPAKSVDSLQGSPVAVKRTGNNNGGKTSPATTQRRGSKDKTSPARSAESYGSTGSLQRLAKNNKTRDKISPAKSVDSLGSTGSLKRATKNGKARDKISPAKSTDSLGSTGSLQRQIKNGKTRDKISPAKSTDSLGSTGSLKRLARNGSPKIAMVARDKPTAVIECPPEVVAAKTDKQVAAAKSAPRDKTSRRMSPLNRGLDSDDTAIGRRSRCADKSGDRTTISTSATTNRVAPRASPRKDVVVVVVAAAPVTHSEKQPIVAGGEPIARPRLASQPMRDISSKVDKLTSVTKRAVDQLEKHLARDKPDVAEDKDDCRKAGDQQGKRSPRDRPGDQDQKAVDQQGKCSPGDRPGDRDQKAVDQQGKRSPGDRPGNQDQKAVDRPEKRVNINRPNTTEVHSEAANGKSLAASERNTSLGVKLESEMKDRATAINVSVKSVTANEDVRHAVRSKPTSTKVEPLEKVMRLREDKDDGRNKAQRTDSQEEKDDSTMRFHEAQNENKGLEKTVIKEMQDLKERIKLYERNDEGSTKSTRSNETQDMSVMAKEMQDLKARINLFERNDAGSTKSVRVAETEEVMKDAKTTRTHADAHDDRKWTERARTKDTSAPVSILKRKGSREETAAAATHHTSQPVTFSIVAEDDDAVRHRRVGGILKKHSSLDEAEILRRRSCSPVTAVDATRPILKRRSSLEELVRRAKSPDPQSILKRRESREEAIQEYELGSPERHGILKTNRRPSAPSSPPPTHVSIADAVLMAVADATCSASSNASSTTRPILKKASSDEYATADSSAETTPRPILKKPHDEDWDGGARPPVKTILKSSRRSSKEEEDPFSGGRSEATTSDSERGSSPRYETAMHGGDQVRTRRRTSEATVDELASALCKRRSLESSPVPCFVDPADERRRSPSGAGGERATSPGPPLSVADRISQMEREMTGGGTQQRRERDKERHRTQPITREDMQGLRQQSPERSMATTAMAAQMKAMAEEAAAVRRRREARAPRQTQPVTTSEVQQAASMCSHGNGAADQAEESNEDDASKLSLAERVLFFNRRAQETSPTAASAAAPKRAARSGARFKTQPVTLEELGTAQRMPTSNNHVRHPTADLGTVTVRTSDNTHLALKGILKAGGGVGGTSHHSGRHTPEPDPALRSMLKKETTGCAHPDETGSHLPDRSILKTESSDPQSSSGSSSDSDADAADPGKRHPDLSDMLYCVSRGQQVAQERKKETDLDDRKLTSMRLIEEFNQSRKAAANGSARTTLKDVTANGNARMATELKDSLRSDKDALAKRLNSSKRGGEERSAVKGDEGAVVKNAVISDVEVKSAVRKATADEVSSSADTTSEGESSSGGREVKRIIRNEAIARRRQAAINKHRGDGPCLPKSPSLSQVGQPVPSSGGPQGLFSGGLRRSMTQPMESEDNHGQIRETSSIAERLAALKKNQDLGWQKRLPKLKAEDDLSVIATQAIPKTESRSESSRESSRCESRSESSHESSLDLRRSESESLVAERRGRLVTAAQGWKKRVEPTDAVNFSVAGRMRDIQSEVIASPLLAAGASERLKKTPRPHRFRSKAEPRGTDARSNPASPHKELVDSFRLQRSASAPGGEENTGVVASSTQVEIPRADNETFSAFFTSCLVTVTSSTVTTQDITTIVHDTVIDLDQVGTEGAEGGQRMLGQRRTVKMQRRRYGGSRNPLRALAQRTDLREQYEEVRTGVAERELRRLQVEKLSQTSHMAVEALAGLASSEDFTAVSLKKASAVSPYAAPMLPFSPLMLIQVKGRRHVQSRLVEPRVTSLNSGDSFVLVTPNEVYNWVGRYSNVIERSRSAEIASLVSQRKDLGCSAGHVTTVTEGKGSCPPSFWSLLSGDPADSHPAQAGHPDEDELYEASLVDTNMVYEVCDRELVPLAEYWGALPRIDMLNPAKVLVFDFGTELYVWCGKNATPEARKNGTSLATELWAEGYDYSECDVNPVTAATELGSRTASVSAVKAGVRPDWALCAKVNQHMETVLFREKFQDWPDFSRVIRVGGKEEEKGAVDGSVEVKPCDARLMYETALPDVSLELEGSNVGRGLEYIDPETGRVFEVLTRSVTVWHVDESEHTELPAAEAGQFYSGDSYVVRWAYAITVAGRELGGLPSRHHATTGRERWAYFCWQGSAASLNEQGAAALTTVELDKERGAQVRVVQGAEPPAFLNLFGGRMCVHEGRRKQEAAAGGNQWRLYMCRGERETETVLVQVACSVRQLRSRASLVLVHAPSGRAIVWHGAKAAPHTRHNAMAAARHIATQDLSEATEGREMPDLLAALGGSNRHLYHSLAEQAETYDHTPRLFHLGSSSGSFVATEVGGAYRCGGVTVAFPFLQEELYSCSQPALFLLDSGRELWLWQGWWPEREGGEEASDATGSGYVRWQAERRAAMQTAVDYWLVSSRADPLRAYLVWAGLEPLAFTNLFPLWVDRDDVAECNMRDGRKPGEVLRVAEELAGLTCLTYSPARLLQRPLPDGVDPTRLEVYLDPEHFQDLLGISKEEFEALPSWKQTKVKKQAGLF